MLDENIWVRVTIFPFNMTKYKFILQFIHNTNGILLAPAGHLIEDERFRRIPLSKRGTVNYDKGPKLLTILYFSQSIILQSPLQQ